MAVKEGLRTIAPANMVDSFTHPLTRGSWVARLAIAAALLSSSGQSARGQQSPNKPDAAPPYTSAEPQAIESGELLLSYRRDDAPNANGYEGSPNPLRQAAQSATPQSAESPAPVPITTALASPNHPEPAQPAAVAASPETELLSPSSDAADVTRSSDRAKQLSLPPVAADPMMRYDAAVAPAIRESESGAVDGPTNEATAGVTSPEAAPTSPDSNENRRLAPPSEQRTENTSEETSREKVSLPFSFSKLESMTTAGTGLVIVIGLFLGCMFLLRRGAKTTGQLPTEAFAVLGRAPLTSNSNAHLLRIGNKLVLVAVSADGAHPLTEVTDPLEVDRIAALCASGKGYGPAAEFQQVLAQLAREPARGFLGKEASSGNRRLA